MRDPSRLSSISEAIDAIGREVRLLPAVTMPLLEAAGLTLAEPVRTDIDYPPFDKAMMDGFAVRSADCRAESTTLQVIGELAAGQAPVVAVGPGQAMRINTGAPIPNGA